jgi:uncharacterized protein YggE
MKTKTGYSQTKQALAILAFAAISLQSLGQVQGNYASPAAAGNYQDNGTERYSATYATPNTDNITIKVNGIMNVLADNYVAVFNIIQVGPTASSADSLMNNRITQFKKGLRKIGVDTEDIKVDMISFIPKYEYKTDNTIFSRKYIEVPAGFELQKNVYIRFKYSKSLDGILSAAAIAEIYDLIKVDYFIPNNQKLLDSLRLRCLEEVKSRVKSYQVVGFKLDTLKKTMSDDFKIIYPETKYTSFRALSRTSISALKKNSGDQPNVTQVDFPTSRFYSQVKYDEYDIVINPVITEPVVQLSYSITVIYSLKAEDKPVVEEKQKDYYYIITANGEVKQLNIGKGQ